MDDDVTVLGWYAAPAARYHAEVWSTWLHGKVAALPDAGRVTLVVPMAAVTPVAMTLALQLWRVGAVTLLD